MEKKFYLSLLTLLLGFVPADAQNTAVVSGNWDVCSTWGAPAIGITKGNDAASAKSIGTGITVTMDTNWNAQSVDFGSTNGILDFNGTANALDLNTAGGTAQSCQAVVTALSCSTGTQSGSLFNGVNAVTANGITKTVPYTGGNGGPYSAQNISSTSITGLTASIPAGNLANGAGTLTFSITGTPSATGTANFSLSLGGQTCTFSVTVTSSNAVTNGTFNVGSTFAGWTQSCYTTFGWIGSGGQPVGVGADASTVCNLTQTGLTQVNPNGAVLTFNVAWSNGAGTGGVASTLQVLYNNVVYASFNTKAINSTTGQVVTMNGATGASVSVPYTSTPVTTNGFKTVSFTLPNGIATTGTLVFRFTAGHCANCSDDIGFSNVGLTRGYYLNS